MTNGLKSMYGSSSLSTGQRLLVEGKIGTIRNFEYDYKRSSFGHTQVVMEWADGTTETLPEWEIRHAKKILNESLALGDRVEVKLDDPLAETFPRGKIIAIDSDDDSPYTVQSLDGTITSKFAAYEIEKILSALSWEKRGNSREALTKLVAEKRAELQALEIALEVLEFAAGAEKG